MFEGSLRKMAAETVDFKQYMWRVCVFITFVLVRDLIASVVISLFWLSSAVVFGTLTVYIMGLIVRFFPPAFPVGSFEWNATLVILFLSIFYLILIKVWIGFGLSVAKALKKYPVFENSNSTL